MKHWFTLFSLFLTGLIGVSIIATVSPAAAVDVFKPCSSNAKNTELCQNISTPGTPGENPVIRILRVTITILSIVIGITAVIMLIIGGLSFITANGDSGAIARARSSIVYALVGLVIASLAQVLVQFVLVRL